MEDQEEKKINNQSIFHKGASHTQQPCRQGDGIALYQEVMNRARHLFQSSSERQRIISALLTVFTRQNMKMLFKEGAGLGMRGGGWVV